ncbi:MAG: hypothetical protein PHU85_05205 [Phycisphaerae bacterium]|nr:hypothetical protein [Phycisphaerae bacterium]
MKRLLAFTLGAALFSGLAGCTMNEDPQDHGRRIARGADLESRQMIEDIDYLLLVDQPSKLTPYYMPSKPH